MATTRTKIGEISCALKLFEDKKQNLYESFLHLQSQSQSQSQSSSSSSSSVNFNFNLKWTDLDSYFTFIEFSLQQKFNFLKTLHSFCVNSDGLGLHRSIAYSRDQALILAHLPDAYLFAPNPAAMVLDVVEGFYSSYYVDECRNACLIMLEALLLFKNKNDINKHCSVELLKDKAMKIALLWNYHRRTSDSVHEKQQNALAFLLIVAAYNLLDGFPINDVMDYFVVVADKPLAIYLCRQMIPNDNVNDLIQKLINEDMHITAVNFSIELQKTDEFSPISLLEERKLMSMRIIDETRKNVDDPHKNDVTLREIDTLKEIIKCIEVNHLESKYPKDSVVELVRKLENEVEESKQALVNEMGLNKQPARAFVVNKSLLPKTKRPKQNKIHPTTAHNAMPIIERRSQASDLLPYRVDQHDNFPLCFYAPQVHPPSNNNSNGWISE